MEINASTRFYMPEEDAFTSLEEQRRMHRFTGFFDALSPEELEVERKVAFGTDSPPWTSDAIKLRMGLSEYALTHDDYANSLDPETRTNFTVSDYDAAVEHAMHHGVLVPVTPAIELAIKERGCGRGEGGRWEEVRSLFDADLAIER